MLQRRSKKILALQHAITWTSGCNATQAKRCELGLSELDMTAAKVKPVTYTHFQHT